MVFKNSLFKEEYLDLASKFVSQVLGYDVVIERILNVELPKEKVESKSMTVDVLLKLSDSSICLIELNPRFNKYLHQRNMAYLSTIYVQNTKMGEEYSEELTFRLIDLTYGLKETEEVRNYYVQTDKQSQYVQNFEILEINMDKVKEYWYTRDEEKIKEYAYIIMTDLKPEELKELNEILEGDEVIMKFKDNVEKLNKEESYVRLWTYEQERNADMKAIRKEALEEGEEKGKAKGLEQGLEQKESEMIQNMYKNKFSLKDIMKVTSFPLSKVQHILGLF